MPQLTLPPWDTLPEIELYMDQVVSIIERALASLPAGEGKAVTPAMVNNYVKQKALPPPVKKRYGRGHVAALFMICTLKRVLSMGEIRTLRGMLLQSRDERECYALFCGELHAALARVTGREAPAGNREAPGSQEAPRDLQALQACCGALAEKLLAQELLSPEA